MMRRGHAISGASGWLGLCALAGPLAGFQPTPVQVGAGAVVATGAALLPDLDHPSSTVARSLGPITRVAARIVSYLSDAVRDGTCDCCDTPGTHGHRTLTHTLVFAILSGVGVSTAGTRWGLASAAVVVGVAAGLAGLGLLPKARRGDRTGRWLLAVLAGAGAWAAVRWLGGGVDWWWLGVPVGWGVLAHALGDGLTHHAVPLWWPLRIRGLPVGAGRVTALAPVQDRRRRGGGSVGGDGRRWGSCRMGAGDRLSGSV